MSRPIRPYTLSPHIAPLAVRDGVVVSHGLRRRKVAVCGAHGVRSMPWDDPSYECWAINNFWNVARDREGRLAASRWWEQHQVTPDVAGSDAGRAIQNAYDLEWIYTCPVPIYVTEPVPENPNAVVWPIEDYSRRYRDYWACTFAMQIATALDEGFEELAVHGLGLLMGTKREATVESACVAYWLGLAEGRGMRIVLRPEDLLLRHFARYGHEYWRERRAVEQYVSRWDDLPTAI